MEKLLSVFLSVFLLICFLSGADLRISAHEEPDVPDGDIPYAGFETITPGVEKLIKGEGSGDGDVYVITGKVTIREDTEISTYDKLYIRNGGALIIKNGAEVTFMGKIVIERGGKLFVTNGTLTVCNVFYNYGRLIIRKDGVFQSNGTYQGNAGSRIVLEGKAYFNQLSLNDAVERIQKFDPNFRLKNYCIDAYNYRTTGGQIYFYYCIGNVRTDYYYRTRTDTDKPKCGRKKLDLKTVYSSEIQKKVSEMAEKDYSENIAELADPAPNLFQINTTYQYSYKKDRLYCEWTWFKYDDEIWMEKLRDGYYGHARRH